MSTGSVVKVAGPLVVAQGMRDANMFDVVRVSSQRLIGENGLKDHDLRYEQAEEFLQLCYKFWEGSWQDDAVRKDKQRRIFTDPAKVHPIQHAGKYYQSQGVFQVSPSVQRTPVLFQAGASPRGLQFAARHAEAVFIGGDKPEKIKAQVDKIRSLAREQGRGRELIAHLFTPEIVIGVPALFFIPQVVFNCFLARGGQRLIFACASGIATLLACPRQQFFHLTHH